MDDSVLSELRKFVAPEFIFGPDARLLVGRYARKLGGRRVLLVSDPGVAAAGWTAEAAGLRVQVSGSLMQARILDRLPAGLTLPGCRTPAQVALQFARSCPGVSTALCGMSRPVHVAENLELLGQPKASPAALAACFGG